MEHLNIKFLGDPVLRKKAKRVSGINKRHQDVLSQMARLMYDSSGIGLAAPQVGLSEAMIVVDVGSGLFKLINPVIIKKSGSQSQEEGCLSLPGICIKVKRAKNIVIRAQDENGKHVEVEAKDLLACVFQHEIDHLRGKLIVDYASFFDKIRLKKKIEYLRQKVKDNELSESEKKSCQLQL